MREKPERNDESQRDSRVRKRENKIKVRIVSEQTSENKLVLGDRT